MRRSLKWLLIAAAVVLAAVTIGPFVYINFIRDDAPDEFSLEDLDDAETAGTTAAGDDATTDTTGADVTADGLDGAWTVAVGSQAGYRATEILFGQEADAAGRTDDVTGTFEIAGTTVTAASLTVDMTTIESDQENRDNQFHDRIMETATFPTATFELTEPLDLGSLPADGEQITVTAQGELTVHGVTNAVTVTIDARLNGSDIEVAGSIPVVFSDYDIDDPSGGPATVGDDGEVEFLLVFTR